jgi:hypothetical protein
MHAAAENGYIILHPMSNHDRTEKANEVERYDGRSIGTSRDPTGNTQGRFDKESLTLL